MNQQFVEKKGLTVKDLVTIGIFSALFLVFTLIGGIFFAPNPVLTFYMPVGSVLLCGRSGCGKITLTRLINGLIPQFFCGRFDRRSASGRKKHLRHANAPHCGKSWQRVPKPPHAVF